MGILQAENSFWQCVYRNDELRTKYFARAIISMAFFVVCGTLVAMAHIALTENTLVAVVLLSFAVIQVL